MDLLVFPNPEQVFAAILAGKDDIIAVPEGLQPDVRAGALQHIVGSFFDLEGEHRGFRGGAGREQDAQDEEGSVPFMEKEDGSGKKTAGPDKKSQGQPP